jgi:lysophospholipase L1-like esterase
MKLIFALTTLLATVPAIAQGQCDPFAVELTTSPSRPDTPSALQEAHTILAAIPVESDLLLIGDSILYGWDSDLKEAFPSRRVWNFSVGGDKVQHVLWRLERLKETYLGPTVTVLFVGTNNLGVRGASACSIFAGIAKIINEVRARWPKTNVFVVTVPPRGADFKDFDKIRIELNELISYNADALDYALVHLEDNLFTCGQYSRTELPKNTASCFPSKSYKCINYRPDNVHFDAAGYEFLRTQISEASKAKFGADITK